MTTRALQVVAVLLVTIASLCHAATPASQFPSQLQTFDLGSGLKPLDLAVSPTGNQLVALCSSGAFFFSLYPDGKIRNGIVNSMPDDKGQKCAFTPNGRTLIVARNKGAVYFFERSTKKITTVDAGTGSSPFGLYVIEDPPLAFVGYNEVPLRVAVINHSGTPTLVESIKHVIPGTYAGLWMCAGADGRFIYVGTQERDATLPYAMFALPCQDRIGVSPWRHNFSSQPTGCCLGPDPLHVLVPTVKQEPDRAMLRLVSLGGPAASTEGCSWLNFQPGAVSFTNDGTYAAVPNFGGNTVKIMSGLDLRARLDPNSGQLASTVRIGTVTLDIQPRVVTMHPTQPVGYAWSPGHTKIGVIKLAVPGIAYPGG